MSASPPQSPNTPEDWFSDLRAPEDITEDLILEDSEIPEGRLLYWSDGESPILGEEPAPGPPGPEEQEDIKDIEDLFLEEPKIPGTGTYYNLGPIGPRRPRGTYLTRQSPFPLRPLSSGPGQEEPGSGSAQLPTAPLQEPVSQPAPTPAGPGQELTEDDDIPRTAYTRSPRMPAFTSTRWSSLEIQAVPLDRTLTLDAAYEAYERMCETRGLSRRSKEAFKKKRNFLLKDST